MYDGTHKVKISNYTSLTQGHILTSLKRGDILQMMAYHSLFGSSYFRLDVHKIMEHLTWKTS